MTKIIIIFDKNQKNIATLVKIYYYITVKFNILFIKLKNSDEDSGRVVAMSLTEEVNLSGT